MTQSLKHYFAVYCVQQVSNGKYVLLNRNYKPIGMTCTNTYVNYEDYAITLKGLGDKTAAKLSIDGKGCSKGFHMYRGTCNFEPDYMNRLDKLMSLKTTV